MTFAKVLFVFMSLALVHQTFAANLPNNFNLNDLRNMDFDGIFQALQNGLQNFGSRPTNLDIDAILNNPMVQGFLNSTSGTNQTLIQFLPALRYIANETLDAVGSFAKLYSTFRNLQNFSLPNFGGVATNGTRNVMQMLQNLNKRYNILGAVEGYVRREIYKAQKETGVPADCYDDLELVLMGLWTRKPWAIKMFDAAGKPTTGMMWGRIQWLGTRPECLEVDTLVQRNITSNSRDIVERRPMKGEYCVATLPFPKTLLDAMGVDQANMGVLSPTGPAIEWGLCIPKTCSSESIKFLINSAIGSYLNASKVVCDADKERDITKDATAISVLLFTSIVAAIILFATLYQGLQLDKCFERRYQDYTVETMNGIVNNGYVSEEKTGIANETQVVAETKPDDGHAFGNEANGHIDNSVKKEIAMNGHGPSNVQVLVMDDKKDKAKEKKQSFLVQFLACFSLYNNFPKIMVTKQPASAITCLHGMRVLSISWVILGHTYSFLRAETGFVVSNPLEVMTESQRFSFYAILSGTLSVDTFFFMSGLLVTYLFLRQLKREKRVTVKTMLLYYFHRYWRLTPIYMIIIWLYVGLRPYLSAGPQKPLVFEDENFCSKNIWTNVLYLNNIIYPKEQCAAWSWYLANDMQFYVIAPLFMIPLFMKPVVGILLTLVALVGSVVVRGLMLDTVDGAITLLTNPAFFYEVYVKPWCRIGPYLVGMMVGYILYRKECKMKMHKFVVFIGWVLGLFSIMCTAYVQYDQVERKVQWSRLNSIVFETLWRTVWSFGLGWIVVACANGYGGFINSILSWSFWVPLSKLTYAAYLIHPVLMFMYAQNLQQLIYSTDYTMAYIFMGHTMVAFAGALVTSLAFEAPFLGLEKLLLGMFGFKR